MYLCAYPKASAGGGEPSGAPPKPAKAAKHTKDPTKAERTKDPTKAERTKDPTKAERAAALELAHICAGTADASGACPLSALEYPVVLKWCLEYPGVPLSALEYP